ncbi:MULTISPECIES: SprT family zinc-dependent metalloprotease [unclassified Psychrobacter]|uniref:M48 family metallopeptidase n=1 Tax=unclassified Psychrobacter TaxID=196806 RepID=UPI0025B59A0C|nr:MULTISPECIES: SprT family zinc-dependent metalloprotease [unclassified Psychrobacter]MDN3454032.1 SprT family zinc-dependent metalloprotease [Psychrobacter sp. APC 3350]MDN3501996.1 SprT family zinc-dependent metalloprotease [Psychrobacter sp. 5A.1]
MTENGVFYYGQDKIDYEVVRKEATYKKKINKPESDKLIAKKAKPRKVVIKVHPDQRVVATAPIDASEEVIHNAMMKRARWIWQSLQDFAKQQDHVLPKRYVSGETQFYLGRRYVLKMITSTETADGINSTVKLSRGKLNVELSQSDSELDAEKRAVLVKRLIDEWYKDKFTSVSRERLEALIHKASWVNNNPSLKLMTMKKQWGSCSNKGNLILNPHLVKAPKECIDYVILHELCHIAEHNHSERFWRLLTQVMPNWKEVKAKLDGMAELYLNE